VNKIESKNKVENGNSQTKKSDVSRKKKGQFCMKGRIYQTRDGFIVRFGRDVSKWFKHEIEAERFLTYLRAVTDQGTFDPRDYRSDKPLAFCNLADKWLENKKGEIKRKSFNNLKNYMQRAKNEWQDLNIKSIGYAEIEDLLRGQKDISGKTKANMKSCLHDYWTWLRKRKIITHQQFPEFPETPYELGYRNITDIATQQKILQEIKRLTYHINPKIWLGIKWLATYVSMRPIEMYNLQEEDIIPDMGILFIKSPKEKSKKRPKLIYLNDDDIEILRNMPRGLPHLYFFRHTKGIKGCKAGQRFGEKYFYKKWKKACSNLGIYELDLYGGTRHTTTTALSEKLTPEQIKQGTLHSTNKAFERYFQADFRNERLVYQTAKDLQQTYTNNSDSDEKSIRHNILKLKGK
jgi:integrase